MRMAGSTFGGRRPVERAAVGAENAVTSCDLHVLVHETAEPVASEGLDSCAGGRGSGPCGRVLIERSVWTVRCEVGPGRGSGLSTGPFPRTASRTRRAAFTATGSP